MLTSIEICAGAGGQALGLEMAGLNHIVHVENDSAACATLRANRPVWNILEQMSGSLRLLIMPVLIFLQAECFVRFFLWLASDLDRTTNHGR